MACPTSDILHAFLDKALPPTQAQSVGEHLAGCDACTAETERVARIASVMSLSRPAPGCLGNAKLAVFAAGQLDKDAAAHFVAHLGRCRKCTDALLVIRRSVNARTPAAQAAVSAAPRSAPRPTVRAARSRSSWGWAAAALALAALGAGVWFAKHSRTQDQGTQVAQPTPPRPPQVAPPNDEPQAPVVVHIGPKSEPDPPKEEVTPPEELVVDPKPPKVPDPLEQPDPTEEPEPPQTPPEDHAAKPPEPEPDPPAPEDTPPPVPTAPKEQPFDLAATVGNVDVQLPGKTTWQTLREGQTLKAEGRLALRVGGSKAARVTFAGHTLSLDKSSELSVALFERDCELALSRGAVIVDSRGTAAPKEPEPKEGDEGGEAEPPAPRKIEERSLSLDLAGGRVHARGARFLAALANRQGRVVAFDGDVHVEACGQNLAVPRGLACVLAEGKGPGEPAKADVAALLAWTRDIETFVTVEAEKGRIKDPMKARTDSGASGGRYVTSTPRERDDDPGYVELGFEAKRAGVFRIFARTSSGERREAGAFRVSVDGAKPREVQVRGRGDEWGWSGLDALELAAGRHVIRFVDPRGGLRVDSIIVTTDTLFHPDPEAQDRPQEAPEGEDRPPRDRPPRDGQGPGGGGR